MPTPRLTVLLSDPAFSQAIVAALEEAKERTGVDFEVVESALYGSVVKGSETCGDIDVFVQIELTKQDVREFAYDAGFRMDEDSGDDIFESRMFVADIVHNVLHGSDPAFKQPEYQEVPLDFYISFFAFHEEVGKEEKAPLPLSVA